MWHYFVAHAVFYSTRCFPKDNRVAIRIFCLFSSLLFLVPQLYVLTLNTTGRACSQPLLTILIVSIGTTFVMLAFVFLFTMMEPVPWKLRFTFHFFGAFSFLIGILQFSYAVTAKTCATTTTELYYLTLYFGIFGIITTIYFLCMLPFWLIEFFWKGRVLNKNERRGICYEPVSNCPCLWKV